MGLSASQMRLMALTARKSDLEYQGQQINQARMNLAYQTEGITTEYSDKMSNKYQDVFTPQANMAQIQDDFTKAIGVNNLGSISAGNTSLDVAIQLNSMGDNEVVMDDTETTKLIDDLVILRDSVAKGDTKIVAHNTLGYGMNETERNAAMVAGGPSGVSGLDFSKDQLVAYLDTMISNLKTKKVDGNNGITGKELKDSLNMAAIALVQTNPKDADSAAKQTAAIQDNTNASAWFLQRILGNADAGQQGGIAFGKLDADGYYTADDAAAEAKYKSDSARIQTQDKRLEIMEKNIDTQHKAIETELDAVKKVLDKNIETSFKTFA